MSDSFNLTNNDPYELRIREKLNNISPNIYERVDEIEKLQDQVGIKVLTILTEYACLGQNTTPIVLARDKIKKMPQDWLVQHLPKVIQSSINLEDEWEYRRLLELLSEAIPQLLREYIKRGLNSNNEEVIETAEDFL